MLALIKKDFEQNLKPILFYFFTVAAFQPLVLLVAGEKALINLFSSTFTVIMLSPIFIGHFFISSEKSKRTFSLLRMLPLSTNKLVVAKEIVSLAMLGTTCLGALVSCCLLLYAKNMLTQSLPSPIFSAWGVLLLLAFTQIMLWSHLRFDQKLAGQIPLTALFALILMQVLIAKYVPNLHHWLLSFIVTWEGVLAGGVITSGLIWFIHQQMVKLIQFSDWTRAIDE